MTDQDHQSAGDTSFDGPLSAPGDMATEGESWSHEREAAISKFVSRLLKRGSFSPEQLQWIEEELATMPGFQGATIMGSEILRRPKQVGDYRILELIGGGGSGLVFRARKTNGDFVALKLLRSRKGLNRFTREMRIVKDLLHPNIIVAYESGTSDGHPYLVMEELSGPNLQDHIERHGAIPWRTSVSIIAQAAQGLAHAHARGLVHRDVKPGNLIYAGKHVVKVADLGLAADTNAVEGDSSFETNCEMIAGTPDFVAPEQARSLKAADRRSDIYSLGNTWHYLLTGASRIEASRSMSKFAQILAGVPLAELPRELLPPDLHALWTRMVASDPKDRPQSMQEIADSLQCYLMDDEQQLKSHLDVLVVEDNHDDLFITVEMLRRMNRAINVHKAYSLREAIEIERDSVDIALLDLNLPDSEGIATVKQFRKHHLRVPLIVLTGQEDPVVGQECQSAGADKFVCKHDLSARDLERLIFVTRSRFNDKR